MPRARYPQDTSTISTRSRPWLYCSASLLGAPGKSLMCPFTTWGSVKRIFLWATGATRPTTRTRFRTWTLDLLVGYPGVRSTLSHMATPPPTSSSPGFSIKRIFPEYWPCGPGTQEGHSTIPTSSRPWAFPGTPGAYRCIRHRSPVPIYTLGFDKTNFLWVPARSGAKAQRGQQYPQLALGPVPNLSPPVPDHCLSFYFDLSIGYPGSFRTMFSHMKTP